LTIVVGMIVGTSKRNGRKRKERNDVDRGEPHGGGMTLREGVKKGAKGVKSGNGYRKKRQGSAGIAGGGFSTATPEHVIV